MEENSAGCRYPPPGRAAKGTDTPFVQLFLHRFAKQSVQSRLVVFSLAGVTQSKEAHNLRPLVLQSTAVCQLECQAQAGRYELLPGTAELPIPPDRDRTMYTGQLNPRTG